MPIDFNEIIGLIAACLTTAAFVPQVYKTWQSKSTEGLSLTMYLFFLIGILLWLYYGIQLNSLPMIIANSVTAVLTLVLIYFKLTFK